MRKIYQAVVVPQILYGLAAWYCPATGTLPATERNQVIRTLARIQQRAAVVISGAFKGTAADALDVELFLRPIRLQMQQNIKETAIRLLTGPRWACPETLWAPRSPKERKKGGGGGAPWKPSDGRRTRS